MRALQWLIKRLPIAISLALLCFAVTIKAGQSEFIAYLQNKVFDLYQQEFPRQYQDAPVKIVDIDEESLKRLGQWPWSRQIVAQLVARLMDMNAAVIGFDIVFAEPDRTSPVNMAQSWRANPELSEMLVALPDHDQMLAEVFESGYIVSGFVLNHRNTERMPEKKFGMSFVGLQGAQPIDHVRADFSGATMNLPILEQASEGNGFFNNIPDNDGIIRSVPLLLGGNGEVYFSLAMESLRIAQRAGSYIVKMAGASDEESFGINAGITHIRNGEFEVPTDPHGQMLLYYTPMRKDRYIPAWEILQEDFDPSRVAGQILLVGTSAPGLLDLRSTPLNPVLPGVEVHAQAIEQMVLGEFLYRPGYVLGAELLVMIVGGLLMIFIMQRLTAIWGAIFMVTLLGLSYGASVYAFTSHGVLVEPVSPTLIILLLYISESLRRYISSESERKQVRSAFSQYMSPALVEELANHPERLKLGGEMREMTLLFADIRGFTTLSEQFDAQGLTEFINQFLTPMTDVILKRQGTIDKYMGDCIMAFWNAPLEVRDHARQGCLAALEMFKAAEALNATRKAQAEAEGQPFLPINIGIGLNTGTVCVGNMGSDQRFDYSVLGDDVNLASRLEGQSKNYGVGIVIGENTFAQLDGLAVLELDLIQVKGKTTAVTIYTVLGDEALADDEAFIKLNDLWEKVLASYRAQQWDEAENFIGLCEQAITKTEGIELSGLFALYRERIRAYRVTPPPEGWSGVFEATSK